MSVRTIASEAELPFSLNLIRRLRSDLCEMYPLKTDRDWSRWVSWTLASGINEYHLLSEDWEFREFLNESFQGKQMSRLEWFVYRNRKDVQKIYPVPEKLDEFKAWFNQHAIDEHNLWHYLMPEEQARLKETESWAIDYEIDSKSQKIRTTWPFGVNLIGYAYGQLGIGEDLRMAARSLTAVGVPISIVNFNPGKGVPQKDRSMKDHVVREGKYAVNLFCLTALEHGRFFAECGMKQIEGRYNIGYWPWELSRWPKPWEDLTRLVDEVWVSTQHTASALAPVSTVPVSVLPMAVDMGEVSRKGRRDFDLPSRAKLFVFSFDINSSIHRKNPQACVDAFLRAFPLKGTDTMSKNEVGLVIKSYKPLQKNPAWTKLKALSWSDDRIHIIEETLPRGDVLALYKSCDCYLSLHRAEGFGRGIAEALQLGLHVIATGYSGNMDFCRPPAVDLVDYKLVRVKKGQYQYHNGQVWASVDLADAAAKMRDFANSRHPPGRNLVKKWPEFSVKNVGDRYKGKLSRIMDERDRD